MSYLTKTFYHIYNRGVEKREIFREEKDYVRFIHCLYEFNDQKPALPYNWLFKKEDILNIDTRTPRELLVNISCFCLMPNHFHLILQQISDGGITKFMRKIGTGYTMYFNKRYERTGVLFQGKFKAIPIETDEYLLHLSRYIHLNPVELIDNKWKEIGISNQEKTQNFLSNYRWYSLLDYIGIKNFPSVTKRDFILSYFKQAKDYYNFIYSFLSTDVSRINHILLED